MMGIIIKLDLELWTSVTPEPDGPNVARLRRQKKKVNVCCLGAG